MKIIRNILAVMLIITAIYTFDWHTWNQILVPVLLLICAAILFTDENPELNKFLNRAAAILSILLILKMLLIG